MSSAVSSRPSASRTGLRPGHVQADRTGGPDRVDQVQVRHHRTRLDHAQHQVGRPQLEQDGGLAHVRLADGHMQPPLPAEGTGDAVLALKPEDALVHMATLANHRWRVHGQRDDVGITAIIQPDGRIWSAWPDAGSPGVVKNPKETK
jgi:hypothetical protein